MCGSMADIQSAAAEITRGKKDRRKIEEETTWQKYNVDGVTHKNTSKRHVSACIQCCDNDTRFL